MEAKQKHKVEMLIADIELHKLGIIDKANGNEGSLKCIIAPDNIEIIDIDGNWEHLTGWKKGEIVGNNWVAMISQEDLDKVELNADTMTKYGVDGFKCGMQCKDGSEVKIEWLFRYLEDIDMLIAVGHVI